MILVAAKPNTRDFISLGCYAKANSLYVFADIQDFGAKMQWYKYLLGELPTVHYSTLKRVISHLAR